MKLIRAFRAIRPAPDLASKVASHPYDVLSREEALSLAKDNPLSFLHINKPEVDCDPLMDVHDPRVYDKGAENLQRFMNEKILRQDSKECYYVYKQVMGDHEQTGLVAAASIDAYDSGLIKKHEFTRPDKETDRVMHMDALSAQVGPVFLTYHALSQIDDLISTVTSEHPEVDFLADDGNRHMLWPVFLDDRIEKIDEAFSSVPCLYVADGHHRSAAASRVRALRRERNSAHTGSEPYNDFLVVVFPHDQMQILDYNRVLRGLPADGLDEFLILLQKDFSVEEQATQDDAKPSRPGEFGVYVAGKWYRVVPNESAASQAENDPVEALDISLLQRKILSPIFSIHDQRTDPNIDFVGGIRGLQELKKRVDSGDWQVAIALYPTSIESLMAVADEGKVMPPKSTWFEPKLKSGLVIYPLE